MKLTLTEFVTLDGVYQGPGAPDEDTTDGFERGGWFVPFMDETFGNQALEWLGQADGLLFGRRTYEAFSLAWPQMNEPDDPFGVPMNSLPKYVVTSHDVDTSWGPATVIQGNVEDELAKLKELPGREIQIHGSGRLARSLMATGLLDEIRLVVAPVMVAQGRRLFDNGGIPSSWSLNRQTATPSGLILLEFGYNGQPDYGSYGV